MPITLSDPAGYEQGDIRYSSSIDPHLDNLFMRYCYIRGQAGLIPIVAVLHGFSQAVSDFDEASIIRMADKHCFIAYVGMRGRDGADGLEDASAREIYDIYDAITYIKANFRDVVDPDQICVCGYSGGGGNALAFATKFPDTAQYIVSHFGISDYGYDVTDGWYQNGATAGQKTLLEEWIGGTPTAVSNSYRARNAVAAIPTFTGGHLWLFHDDGDTSVPIVNSQNIGAEMLAASLTNYTENYTDSGDGTRWLHDLPNTGEPVINTEAIWLDAVEDKDYQAWTVPTSKTIRVNGYVKNKRFELWLGDGDDAATVAYDTTTRVYTVTPLTGTMTVWIRQDNYSAIETISGATAITLA